MRARRLESLLSDVAPFEAPKQALEQYPTNPELAAGVVHHARARGDVEDKVVVDLGCGTGMLAIAAIVCDAGGVIGIDVDADALATARANCARFDPALEPEFVLADVVRDIGRGRERVGGDDDGTSSSSRRIPIRGDTVLMNPPFGTRRAGADVAFLKAAFKIASGAIYSFHKTSTRSHIERVAMMRFGAREAEVLAQM
ncbi:S-adenosyl-L-methionine-dependent methyltransferase, partial [Ostreococcus tauri]